MPVRRRPGGEGSRGDGAEGCAKTYLLDVRATNAGNGWQLEPVPNAAKKAFNAIGLTPPDKIS